jgi:hypothetical protein
MSEVVTHAPKVYLDREGLLALADRVIEELHVPEWHAYVRVGSWDGTTRWKVIRAWPSGAGATSDLNLLALVAAYSLVDEDGVLLYTERDIPALARKNARALDRIMTVALRINGLEAGAVDALGKGSAPAENGASTSSSLPISG